MIRFIKPSDCPELLKIYAQYIETPITFECITPSEQDFAQRIAAIADFYPYLVCEENNNIVGYAYAHRQMEREAYQWNAELSIYLDPTATAKGLGTKFYNILIEILQLQGIKTVYGGVTVPNSKSENLHLNLGFQPVGTYRNTGYKAGKWHDVTWFAKTIAPYEPSPIPISSIQQIPPERLQAIISTYQ